jgi:hypothetical protein
MTRQAKQMAESLTNATTRRGFLSRLARVAGGAAAGLTAILAAGPTPGSPPGRLAKGNRGTQICYYECPSGEVISKRVNSNRNCPYEWKGCWVIW